MLEVLLAVISAFFFGASNILVKKGLRGSSTLTAYLTNISVSASLLWLICIILQPKVSLDFTAVWPFLVSGIFGTAMGRVFYFASIDKVGSSVSSIFVDSSPLYSTFLAVILLRETVSLTVIIGTFLIVSGLSVLSVGRDRVVWRDRALIFPFMAGVFFGVSQVLRKFGLTSAQSPIFGATLNTTVALLFFTLFLLFSGHLAKVSMNLKSGFFFASSGVMSTLSIVFLFTALNIGRVSLVVPLWSASPLFVLPMAHYLLKEVELVTSKVVLGAVFAVVGAMLVTGFIEF